MLLLPQGGQSCHPFRQAFRQALLVVERRRDGVEVVDVEGNPAVRGDPGADALAEAEQRGGEPRTSGTGRVGR